MIRYAAFLGECCKIFVCNREVATITLGRALVLRIV